MSATAPPSRAPTRSQTAATGGTGSSSRAQTSRQSFQPHGMAGGVRKAKYRPMVTVARRRTVSRMSEASTVGPNPGLQDQLSTIDEDTSDTDSITTALTSEVAKPRYVYHPPANAYAAREMATVTRYLEVTNVSAQMLHMTKELLARGNLPYNPYPGLVSRMHHLAEGFHMYNKTDDSIRAGLQNTLQKTSTPILWGVKGHINVWGLRDVVHVVDPGTIEDYAWLLSTMPPARLSQSEEGDVKGEILVALTGSSVFTGTFYQNPPSVDFSLEFLIYGSNIEAALMVFARTLRGDVKRTVSTKYPHYFIGIQTMKPDGRPTLWSRSDIENEKDAFHLAVIAAVRQKQPPVMKMICAMDEKEKTFKKGSKQYVFHFIEMDSETGSESFISFSEHPYHTLFSSVFLKKASAEAYVAAFRRNGHQGQATTTSPSARPETEGTSRVVSRRGRGPRGRETPAPKQTTQTTLAENTKAPIRSELERELAGLSMDKGDAARIIHLVLHLALLDRPKFKMEDLVTIYRFLHSTASKFNIACTINPTLRSYIKQNDKSKQPFATKVFMQYKRALLKALDPSLHERSSDQCAAFEFLQRELDKVTEIETTEDGSRVQVLPFTLQTQAQLLRISHYCESIQLALNEDTLAYIKQLNLPDLISECRQKFPDELKRPETREKLLNKTNKKKGTKSPQRKQPVIFKHGVEANAIMQQNSLYVNVQWSLQTSMHPVVMATEGVLMQYLIDVKLDRVWRSFLMELMMADHLPPNPYPRLITRLRQAACKMALCREADEKLRAKLLAQRKSAVVIDRASHVFELEECGAYGLSPALATVTPTSFDKLKILANLMINKDLVSHRGQFQISSSQAVSGHSPLYGRMMPYLPYLQLHEHYYIRGPQRADQTAIQLYAKLLYDHLADLCSTDKYVITGLFVGNALVLSQDQLEEDQSRAESIIVDAATHKDSICLKLMYAVGWRYVPIHKYFMLYYLFVDNAEDKFCAYFRDDPIYLYQNVFVSPEEAREHFRQSGASMNGNPMSASNVATVNKSIDQSVQEALDNQDLILVHKLLMTKALINKGAIYLSDTWRMMQSAAFQFDYLLALVLALADIVRYALQHPDAVETPEYLEEIAAAKAKAKKGTTVPTKKFPIRASVLGFMMTALREKVGEVLANPTAMTPFPPAHLAQERLREVVERNPQTGEVFLIINKQSFLWLGFVHDLLLPIKAALERDVHQACSLIQEELKKP